MVTATEPAAEPALYFPYLPDHSTASPAAPLLLSNRRPRRRCRRGCALCAGFLAPAPRSGDAPDAARRRLAACRRLRPRHVPADIKPTTARTPPHLCPVDPDETFPTLRRGGTHERCRGAPQTAWKARSRTPMSSAREVGEGPREFEPLVTVTARSRPKVLTRR